MKGGRAVVEAVPEAIADPKRRAILQLVRERELSAGHIAEYFEITREAVSHHLRVLRDAGLLIEAARRDPAPLPRRPITARGAALVPQQFWDCGLARLVSEAERRPRRTRT